jgi:rod shape-determining protein MreC
MLEFLRRNQVLLSSGVFLLLSFLLLSANRSGTRRYDPLGAVFLEALRPMQSVTVQTTGAFTSLWNRYLALVSVSAENDRLKARVRALEAERHRDEEIELENHRLAKLLGFREDVPSQGVTARVIGRDASGLFQTLALDRGDSDGIKAGMAVVCADGVVGRIAQTSWHASRVLLISDHNSGVDALVQRTRARGIVEGALSGACSMKYIKRDDEVDIDDVVVTSGLDGIFPKGIRIGHVSGVTKKDVGLFQVADVTPAADFSKLEEVMVMTSPPLDVNAAIDAAERARATPVPTPEPTVEPTQQPTPKPGTSATGASAAARHTAASSPRTPTPVHTRAATPRPSPRPTPPMSPPMPPQ